MNGDGNGGDTSYIKKCYNTGTIISYVYSTENTAYTESYTGGIVGRNNCGFVEESYNTGKVEGLNYVGGIAGLNSAYIWNSYNSGEVKATIFKAIISNFLLQKLESVCSGGIVGQNFAEINSCYNVGAIKAEVPSDLNEKIYGYASAITDVNNKNGIIKNCYAAGFLEASTGTNVIKENLRKYRKLLLFKYII